MNPLPAIALIGMPGSGKSTLGQRLANKLGTPFIDTDQLIEKSENCSLQTLLDQNGLELFKAKESAIIKSLRKQPAVIATGGSAVYSPHAMRHLQQFSTVVWLQVNLQTICQRIHTGRTRGIARSPNQSLAKLLIERTPLYRKFADLAVKIDEHCIEGAAQELWNRVTTLR